MIAARTNDGRGGPFTPVIGTTPGVWRPTPPLFASDPTPWVGNVRPFLVPNVRMLRSAGPNPLTSRAYAKDFNEVKAIGALHSTTRTPDETDAAIFWQDHAFALWNRVFRSLAADHHLAIADSARLLATTNLAAADAAIGCWNNKYHYNSWRPITAIREADTDANPATTADPTWTPLFDPATPVAAGQLPLATPPFPENPSGHNCAAGSILGTLRYFFGTNDVSFTATSNKSGTTRTFHSLSDALQENINARVWAGIHFRTADLQGVKLGTTVARYLHQHYFQPAHTTTTATDPPDPGGANPQHVPQATHRRRATLARRRAALSASGGSPGWVHAIVGSEDCGRLVRRHGDRPRSRCSPNVRSTANRHHWRSAASQVPRRNVRAHTFELRRKWLGARRAG